MFLALIPARVWAELAGALALVALFGAYTLHERHIGAAHELAAVKAENAAVTAAAQAQIAALSADYADRLKGAQDAFIQNTLAADKQHAADIDRLRKLAAYYQSHAVLPSAGGTGTTADPGSAVIVGLGEVSANLAADLRAARDQLGLCYAERDSLTGK